MIRNVPYKHLPFLISDVCFRICGHNWDKEIRLLLGIAAAESSFYFREQLGGGPARGLWQMEPDTALSIFVHHFPGHIDRFEKLTKLWLGLKLPLFEPDKKELGEHLRIYDDFACAMARIKILTVPDKIPEKLEEQAEYWHQFYKSPLGARGPEAFINAWNDLDCYNLMDDFNSKSELCPMRHYIKWWHEHVKFKLKEKRKCP